MQPQFGLADCFWQSSDAMAGGSQGAMSADARVRGHGASSRQPDHRIAASPYPRRRLGRSRCRVGCLCVLTAAPCDQWGIYLHISSMLRIYLHVPPGFASNSPSRSSPASLSLPIFFNTAVCTGAITSRSSLTVEKFRRDSSCSSCSPVF